MLKSYLPINLEVAGKTCVVFGGGKVAERKIRLLLEFRANVIVVSPEITAGIKRLVLSRKVKYYPGKYSAKHLVNAVLVIGATSDSGINQKISEAAGQRGILVNIVDSPKLCNFIVPSKIKRGPLVVSISTSGQAPALAKALRVKLEKIITPSLGKLARSLGEKRKNAKS